jgi:YD repeat-containing protein
MNKTLITIISLFLLSASSLVAEQASARMEIMTSLGNIDLNGIPRASFDLGAADGLAGLGFFFKLIHRTSPGFDRNARTEWDITGLMTCVHMDGQGNLTWMKPNGRKVRFQKEGDGFALGNDGSRILSLSGDELKIMSTQGIIWKYQGGFIKSVTDGRVGEFSFTTDRESIMTIIKSNDKHAGKPLLRIVYSDKGEVEKLIFPNNRQCRLQWDSEHRLSAVEDAYGKRTVFTYDNDLLAGWQATDGSSNTLKWLPRENPERGMTFGLPPVRLGGDALFRYEYGREGGINTIRIHTVGGSFVSETRSNSKGIEQRTPYGSNRHVYKK